MDLILLFLVLGQLRRGNVPRQQRFDLIDGAGRGQIVKEVVQVRVRLHVIGAGRHYQREEIGVRLGTDRVVTEEPCLSAGRVMFYLSFDIVVVDWDFRVLQMSDQLRPLFVMPDAA